MAGNLAKSGRSTTRHVCKVGPPRFRFDTGKLFGSIASMQETRFRGVAVLASLLLCAATAVPAADDYQLGPESMPREGVPKGKVEQFKWTSKIFEGTVRDVWVYVPAQYDASKPTAFTVFQDGGGMVHPQRSYRVPVVFDNLIDKGDIPTMIGIFINPGEVPPTTKEGKPRRNRSFEYDTLSDQYVRFLLEEILPEVKKRYSLNLTDDPKFRAICGNSSGGICAFTAAWERPDKFGKVISHIGSFTNIRGGHNYPALIRKTEPKPIRVFLQDGTADLDNMHGNWPLANMQMAAALKYQKYDHKLVLGEDGGHNGKHAGSIFPETLRWVWRDWKN